MRRRKFRPGETLSPDEAIRRIAAGCYVYWQHKPQHPGWMGSMRLQNILWAARSGLIREAILNEEPNQ